MKTLTPKARAKIYRKQAREIFYDRRDYILSKIWLLVNELKEIELFMNPLTNLYDFADYEKQDAKLLRVTALLLCEQIALHPLTHFKL